MINYIKHQWIWAIIFVYIFIAFLLIQFFNIDIGIPCIWTLVFETNCWGCGLTHAFYSCLRLDFISAWNANPLIYLVIPSAGYFIYRDWSDWTKSQRS